LQFPQELKKCVAFLALKKADDSFVFVGTAFFLADRSRPTPVPLLVTAKHVWMELKAWGLTKSIFG